MKKTFASILLASGILTSAHAQLLTVDFSNGYLTGNLSGQNGWAAVSGAGTNPIQVAGGVAVVQAVSGEDDNVAFTSAFSGTDGTVTATLGGLKVTTAGSAGSYFFALAGGLANTSYTGRLFAKSTSGGYFLGIIPGNAGTVAYGTTVLSLNTAYDVSISYGFVSGVNNDSLSISVGGSPYATYATAFDFGSGATNGTATLGSAVLRQDSGTSTGATFSTIGVAAVPEPGTVALVGLGLGAALFGLRRRQKA